MADAQGLSVSATINGGWSGVFAGEISVTNLVDVSAGTDWNVALVIDVPLTSVSNFDVESSLRSDGHYEVSLSPKAWSAPLALGASQCPITKLQVMQQTQLKCLILLMLWFRIVQ